VVVSAGVYEPAAKTYAENGHLPTDGELVEQAAKGDMEAFHLLVDRYASYLFALAAGLLGNQADAEDVVQECLTGAFRGLHSFRRQSSVKTWLTAILIRQVSAFRRSRSLWRRAGALKEQAPPSPSQGPRSDARLDVRAAIATLPEEFRQVIVLRELLGLSYEEIAQVLDVPRGTVESRLFRGRKLLREALKDYLP
jgi:RNA polymerase sigma-70 factor, ECF subfamily